jgi:hypothetical protein
MRLELKKFGIILISRPAGREAAAAIAAYLEPGPDEPIELDFSGVVSVGPSWLDEVLTFLRSTYGKNRVRCLPTDNPSVHHSLSVIDEGAE